VIHREIPPCICRVGFAVKRQKRAVRRNTARRLLRESFRLHKHVLAKACVSFGIGLKCVIMYSTPADKEDVKFRTVDDAMTRIIASLVELLSGECLHS
jgi:ribonuclease P protein component